MSVNPVSFDDIVDATNTTRYQIHSTAERRTLLANALDAWIASVPHPACTCTLSHRNTDGYITIRDPWCPCHGDIT